MRLATPRVPPLADDEIDPSTRDRFGSGPMLNIFRTLARSPKLLSRWLVFANHILGHNSMPPRERELVILRIGWLCRSGYEWGQHVAIGRGCGLEDEEIERIPDGPDAEGWSAWDRVLLQATDELHADAFVSDPTWDALRQGYRETQCVDFVFTVGQYNLVSMALNTFGVQPEDGLTPLPRR